MALELGWGTFEGKAKGVSRYCCCLRRTIEEHLQVCSDGRNHELRDERGSQAANRTRSREAYALTGAADAKAGMEEAMEGSILPMQIGRGRHTY